MNHPLLEVDNLHVRYGAMQALFGVDFAVDEGSVLAVLGSNGAGKSTLARAVTGLVRPCQGTVTFSGVDVTGWSPHRIRRAGLVHVPEGRGIFPGLSVQDNVRMAAHRVGSPEQRKVALERVYELFPALAERRRQRAGTLSGGEQQMLALARALAVPPRLIFADEMSLGLAPRVVDAVFARLGDAVAAGVTVVLVEQFIHRALAIADQCVILRQGHVAWSGAASAAHDEVLLQYLGEVTEAVTPR